MKRTRNLIVVLLAVLVVSLLTSPADAAVGSFGLFQREAPSTSTAPSVTGGEGSSSPVVEVLYVAADLWSAPFNMMRMFSVIW